jgi:hypothetical protein
VCVCVCIEGGGVELKRRPLFTNNVTLKVRLNEKVLGRTKFGNTQTDWLTVRCLKSDGL